MIIPLTYQLSLQLDESNLWYCNRCKEHKAALKKVDLWQPPEILVVGLKRFRYDESSSGGLGSMRSAFAGLNLGASGGVKKRDNFVEFPVRGLDLTDFVHPKARAALAAQDKESSFIYDLFGVCNHYGLAGFGHYT